MVFLHMLWKDDVNAISQQWLVPTHRDNVLILRSADPRLAIVEEATLEAYD